MLDLRQTTQYAKYMRAIGWKVDKSQGFFAYIRRFPILGHFIKIQRPAKLSYEAVDLLRKKYKPFQIVIEPKFIKHQSLITSHGFKLSKTYFVPSKTVQVNLTKTEKELLKEMHYKTRYNIKKTSNKFQVTSSKDINTFAKFWQKCAGKQRGMFLSQKKEIIEIFKAFKKNAYIINVHKGVNGSIVSHQPIAGILLLCTKDASYYMYAASSAEGKKLFAPTLAIWEAIKLSKKLKLRIFDFEGIYDERFPIKSWTGFTRFKLSFGGNVVEHPGTYSRFMLPFKLNF